jgi:fatty acid desaturase
MQHNLEDISFDEVSNEKGLSYALFRKTLSPRYGKVLADILKGYFFLVLISTATIMALAGFYTWWWLIVPLSGLLTGYTAAYLALFIHEAGHYNIHPDKKQNERLASFFLCLPFGLSLKAYRKIHWQHHLHLGTPEDTEVSYFNAPSNIFILETLTGIHLLRTMARKKKAPALTREQQRESRIMLFSGIIFHTVIIITSIGTGYWPFALAWVIGWGVFFPFFATIRQLLEHRDELAGPKTDFTKHPHGKVSRIFVHTFFSSSFGPAGFTRHMIHHWDPQLSYTRLKDAEAFLLACEKTARIIRSAKTTYLKTWKKLTAAS